MSRISTLWLAFFCLIAGSLHAADTAELIQVIKKVGPQGEGHTAAIQAVKELSKSEASALLPLLKSFDGATPLAANWLLGAFESIADRAFSSQQLPAKELEAFAVEINNQPNARRVAYEWLQKVDPTATERLIPGMLLDPSPEFRRDAVEYRLQRAKAAREAKDEGTAKTLFREALQGAVDEDQVQAIVKPLREMGETVDVQKQFGFIPRWRLLGPFDNTDNKGFDAVYPPEQQLNFDAKYAGKEQEIAWIEFATEDEYGIVDLAKALSPHKGAVTYAATDFVAEKAQAVEFRLGTPNSWKLWVNGKLVFARDEYHRGMQIDQYRVPAQLTAGKNVILLKICQNEQKEEWAQRWQYQIRVCDAAGAAIQPAATATTQRSQPPVSALVVSAQGQ